jgi:allophanate hydrolase subunit 2
MGYRLDGPALHSRTLPAFPSEPTCIGAIQAPQGGAPIVLMHDGPTVGGYPKIAVIRRAAIGTFAQRTPGDPVQFVLA